MTDLAAVLDFLPPPSLFWAINSFLNDAYTQHWCLSKLTKPTERLLLEWTDLGLCIPTLPHHEQPLGKLQPIDTVHIFITDWGGQRLILKNQKSSLAKGCILYKEKVLYQKAHGTPNLQTHWYFWRIHFGRIQKSHHLLSLTTTLGREMDLFNRHQWCLPFTWLTFCSQQSGVCAVSIIHIRRLKLFKLLWKHHRCFSSHNHRGYHVVLPCVPWEMLSEAQQLKGKWTVQRQVSWRHGKSLIKKCTSEAQGELHGSNWWASPCNVCSLTFWHMEWVMQTGNSCSHCCSQSEATV